MMVTGKEDLKTEKKALLSMYHRLFRLTDKSMSVCFDFQRPN